MKTTLFIGVLFLCAAIALLYFNQRRLIYYPSREIPQPRIYQAADMQLIKLVTKDGLTLQSWYKPPQANKPTILYFHGNAGHIGYRMPIGRQLMNAGFGLLLLEYRGYGGNPGAPSEEGFYNDARAAVQFLQKQGQADKRLIFYGESIGTGVAVKLAAETPVCALILQSPYTSLADVARYHYPWIFLKPWDKFDSINHIKKINTPVLILHGDQDTIVPYVEGEALFKEANEPKKMIKFTGYGHNNLWSNPDFFKNIIEFIQKNCS